MPIPNWLQPSLKYTNFAPSGRCSRPFGACRPNFASYRVIKSQASQPCAQQYAAPSAFTRVRQCAVAAADSGGSRCLGIAPRRPVDSLGARRCNQKSPLFIGDEKAPRSGSSKMLCCFLVLTWLSGSRRRASAILSSR